MTQRFFTQFDTAIGVCAIAWDGAGRIVGAQLPLPDAIDLGGRMRRRFADIAEAAPTPAIQPIVESIVSLMQGQRRDFPDAELAMDEVPDFHRRVYALTRAIPPGRTRSYGALALDLGDLALSRAVGQALGDNPFPIIVPCHRVLGSNGKAGGFSANGGVETKMRMLSIEKARVGDAPSLFDDLPLAAPPRRHA